METMEIYHEHEPISEEESGVNHFVHGSNSISDAFNRIPGFEFPMFDGSNPKSWLLKCWNYFRVLKNIADGDKVAMAGLHCEGSAAIWYGRISQNDRELSWDQFVGLVLARFDKLNERMVLAEFNKLRVTASLEDYIDKFEELKSYLLMFKSRTYDDRYFIDCFISGLTEESRHLLSSFDLQSHEHVIEMARNVEAIVEALAKRANLGSKNLLPLIKLLSTAEMKARRGNGLCFTCDERISLEHKCEHNKLYVIMTQEEEEAYLRGKY